MNKKKTKGQTKGSCGWGLLKPQLWFQMLKSLSNTNHLHRFSRSIPFPFFLFVSVVFHQGCGIIKSLGDYSSEQMGALAT